MKAKKQSQKTNKTAVTLFAIIGTFGIAVLISMIMLFHYGVFNPNTPEKQYEKQRADISYGDAIPDDSVLPDGMNKVKPYIDDGDGNIFTSAANPNGWHFKEREDGSYAIADKDGRTLDFVMENGTGTYRYSDNGEYAGVSQDIMAQCSMFEYLDGTVG